MSQRSAAEIDLFARTLAKQGVNLVRIHGATYVTSGPNFGQNDTNQVLRTQRLIAALKRQGIYSCLSIYFPLWVQLGPENTAFPATPTPTLRAALFQPAIPVLYRTWWTAC